ADAIHLQSKKRDAFDAANAAYDDAVDWALDITEAQFADFEIRGISSRLIRRDPATQVVVTRDKALADAWRTLDLSETHWPTAIDSLIRWGLLRHGVGRTQTGA